MAIVDNKSGCSGEDYPIKIKVAQHHIHLIYFIRKDQNCKEMNLFTIRIELHSGLYNPDFQILHDAMGKRGFSRTIRADSGTIYHLPRGEYYISSDKTCLQILEDAKDAIKETKHTAEILVTEAKKIHWDGLSEKK